MSDSESAPVMVDFKDLACVILKKSGAILAVALGFAVLGAVCVPLMHRNSNAEAVSYNTLDTSVKLRGESDEAYQSRVMNVDLAMTMVSEINILQQNNEALNDYYANSLLMQLEPDNTACTQVRVTSTVENSIYSCIYDVMYGDYLEEVASEFDYNTDAVRELILCDNLTSLTISDEDENVDYVPEFMIKVVGPSTEFTDRVMDAIETELDGVEVSGRLSMVTYDEDVLEAQMAISTYIGNTTTRINQLNTTLDTIAKSLGYANRNVFFEPSSAVVTSGGGGVSKTTYVKYAGAGFIGGLVLAAAYFALVYIWGRKILSQRQFFLLFDGVKKIGVCKPQGKRSKFTEFFDKKTSDDSGLSSEDTNKLIKANLANLSEGRILITGTSDDKSVQEAIKSLGGGFDVKLDLFKNPEILKSASEYDGIVVVEKRGCSEKKVVKEELRLLENSGTKIVGAIIV